MRESGLSQTNLTTILLMESSKRINWKAVKKLLYKLFPDQSGLFSATLNVASDGNSAVIPFGGSIVAALLIDAPLPADWRQIAHKSAHWPAAEEVCARHTAHLVVTVMGKNSNALTCARLTTAIACAVLGETGKSILAGLSGGEVLNSRQTWVGQSEKAFATTPHIPVNLWVSVHPFKDESSQSVGVVTQGLARFIGRELELLGPQAALQFLVERAFAFTGYLLDKEPILRDGSTFGVSETERIEIRMQTSERFPGLDVISGRCFG